MPPTTPETVICGDVLAVGFRIQTSTRAPGSGQATAPSGAGLPAGSGTARLGLPLYEQKCLACHGAKGVGKPADALAGGMGSLTSRPPLRTVGSYWPYATTLFDYVRRAMPLADPLSLSNDEVYALSAYVLFLNGLIDEDFQLDAQTLPQVKMPNRNGFVDMSRQ